MVEAWNLQSNREAAILFIVEDVTYNICDQVSLSENQLTKLCTYKILYVCRDSMSFTFDENILMLKSYEKHLPKYINSENWEKIKNLLCKFITTGWYI